jgi:hypothetical protein
MNPKSRRKTLLLCVMLLSCIITYGQEEKFHAIFLYKFIENVSWPDARKNLVIGMMGDTGVHAEFEKMVKARGNTNLTVKKIDLDDAYSCDVVFVPASRNAQFTTLLERTTGRSILIISETPDMGKKGAGIVFLKEGTKLSFAINKSSLEARNLKISTTLLSLGKEI